MLVVLSAQLLAVMLDLPWDFVSNHWVLTQAVLDLLKGHQSHRKMALGSSSLLETQYRQRLHYSSHSPSAFE
jgi:hypothetical protein